MEERGEGRERRGKSEENGSHMSRGRHIILILFNNFNGFNHNKG